MSCAEWRWKRTLSIFQLLLNATAEKKEKKMMRAKKKTKKYLNVEYGFYCSEQERCSCPIYVAFIFNFYGTSVAIFTLPWTFHWFAMVNFYIKQQHTKKKWRKINGITTFNDKKNGTLTRMERRKNNWSNINVQHSSKIFFKRKYFKSGWR